MYNRAEEFKKNVDFNEVKDKIYNQLIIVAITRCNKVTIIFFHRAYYINCV